MSTQKIRSEEGKRNVRCHEIPAETLSSDAQTHRPHAVRANGTAVSRRQSRSVPSPGDVFTRRGNYAPLSARVTQKQAPRNAVADEEEPARAADAQGHYRAPAPPFPGGL